MADADFLSSSFRTRQRSSGAPFSLNTPVEKTAANQRGTAILDRDVPGLMANRSYPLFDDTSLSQIATASGGQLTKTRLNLSKLILPSYPPTDPGDGVAGSQTSSSNNTRLSLSS
jgi:hypothetical protein